MICLSTKKGHSQADIPSLEHITLQQIANGLDSELFTAENLVTAYLARIDEVNEEFRAVIEVNKNAISEARQLDESRKLFGRKSLLHGVPIVLKDSIVTLDDMEATAGSLVLIGAKPSEEATVVTKLRAAGSIILGKANMAEWANFRGDVTLAGWSPRGGQAKGVYYDGERPHVSSSGTAAAVRLGLCFAAIDTETDGSMVKPAQAYNIVTIKPTTGLVSRANCIPLADSQDTIGPMAKSVKDAAEILSILAGKCSLDPGTWKMPFDEVPHYGAACEALRLDGFRLGVPTAFFKNEFSEVVMETFNCALSIFERCGAAVVHGTDISTVEEYVNLDMWSKEVVMHTEFKLSMNRYLESLSTNPQKIQNLNDLINKTRAIPEEEAEVRGLELWEAAEKTDPANPEYLVALEREKYLGGDGGIPGVIKSWNLDALLMPSVPKQATHFAMFQGTPMVTVPLGFYPSNQPLRKRIYGNVYEIGPKFPYSLTILGAHFSEEKLIRIAYCFEQLWTIKGNVEPFRMPSSDLKVMS